MSSAGPGRRPVADGTVPRADSPVFTSPNALKLGVFSINVSGTASGISTLPGSTEVSDWSEQQALAVAADRAGFEALVPASRWKGLGGPSGYWDRTYETFVWASALAAVTERIQIFTTAAIPLFHPVMAAKMGATLDHVSNGRWGINIVPGWFGAEFEMFGINIGAREHRYRYAREWIEIVDRLWTETEEFDFDGEFFSLKGAISDPKPVQSPRPLVMNAGQSAEGQQFALDKADMIFVGLNAKALDQNIADLRAGARAQGKRVSIWSNLDIICKSSEREAKEYAEAWMEAGDDTATNRYIDVVMGGDSGSHGHLKGNSAVADSLKLSGGNKVLVGTPEQLVEEFRSLHQRGIDGLTMTWHEYPEGLDFFLAEVHPLMVEAGLRSADPA